MTISRGQYKQWSNTCGSLTERNPMVNVHSYPVSSSFKLTHRRLTTGQNIRSEYFQKKTPHAHNWHQLKQYQTHRTLSCTHLCANLLHMFASYLPHTSCCIGSRQHAWTAIGNCHSSTTLRNMKNCDVWEHMKWREAEFFVEKISEWIHVKLRKFGIENKFTWTHQSIKQSSSLNEAFAS